MSKPPPVQRLPALFALALFATAPHAQPFGALQQDARPFVPAPEAGAMGEAVAAVAHAETAPFYNPAHLARLHRPLRLTVAGGALSTSAGALGKYRFWRDELEPAMEEGIGQIRDEDHPRLEALYYEALDLGRQQSVASYTLYGPAAQYRASVVGWEGAVGAAVFYTGSARLRFHDAGAGIPFLDFYSQTDLIVPVTAAVEVPRSPVAVGVTASYTRRDVAAKAALLETLDAEREHLYVLSASAVTVDVGVHARDVGSGLDLGAAVYGLLGGGFTYRYDGELHELAGQGGDPDLAEVAALEARFNARSGGPSLRVGAAYRVPLGEHAGVSLDGVTVAADYVSASTSELDQTMGAHLRAGVQAELTQEVSLRTGLSQGYPSAGATLTLPGVRLDYAFFGVEDGRAAGQLGRYNHRLRLAFGLF